LSGAVAVGEVVEAEVVKVAEIGFFVKLPTGQEGLVHVSQIANEFVKNTSDYAKSGDKIRVKVLQHRNGRLVLSAKEVEPLKKRVGGGSADQSAQDAFEEKLKKFMITSERAQADLRRNREARRTGRKVSRFRR